VEVLASRPPCVLFGEPRKSHKIYLEDKDQVSAVDFVTNNHLLVASKSGMLQVFNAAGFKATLDAELTTLLKKKLKMRAISEFVADGRSILFEDELKSYSLV